MTFSSTPSAASFDSTADVQVVVIGAGYSGLYSVYRLREAGLTVQGFESGSGPGGTWYWNTYPGAHTDSPHQVYGFSFSRELAEEWSWINRYPSQPEVLAYLEHVADRFDLRQSFRFETRVTSLVYDHERRLWVVTSDDGESMTAVFVLTAVGLVSAPNLPSFKNLESYLGDWYHTGRWPKAGVDFTGKRVAVIGTGSTGIQVIPEIAKQAAELTVFQRTPNYVVPLRNRELSAAEQAQTKSQYPEIWKRIRQHPFALDLKNPERMANGASPEELEQVYEETWQTGGFSLLFESFADLQTDPAANETACEFIRGKIRETVLDPDAAELLSPRNHPYGSKRPPAGTGYYEAFNRDNVTLVDVSVEPIAEITPGGLRVGENEFEFDAIVFATGFDASTGSLTRIDVHGRDGHDLAGAWAEGPVTNLGFSAAGFPNLLMITGPLSPFANLPVCIEETTDWILGCIKYMEAQGFRTVETTEKAAEAWATHATEVANMSVVAQGEAVNAWFTGANIEGKAHAINLYFGGLQAYLQAINSEAEAKYPGFVFK